MRKPIIGVMGPGEGATAIDKERALELGKLIAAEGWILLSGGRSSGVMEAASKGAKTAGGLTVGIIPTDDNTNTSAWIDIPIVTGMGSARNNINVLTSSVVVACGMGSGTASEVSLALKAGTPVVLLTNDASARTFFENLGGSKLHLVESPSQAVEKCRSLLGG